MAVFIFRKATGGSTLRGGDTWRVPFFIPRFVTVDDPVNFTNIDSQTFVTVKDTVRFINKEG